VDGVGRVDLRGHECVCEVCLTGLQCSRDRFLPGACQHGLAGLAGKAQQREPEHQISERACLAQLCRRHLHGGLVLLHRPPAAGDRHHAQLHEQPVDGGVPDCTRPVDAPPAAQELCGPARDTPRHPALSLGTGGHGVHGLCVVEFFYPEEIAAFEPDFVKAQKAAYMETCIEDDEIAERMDAGRKALYERGDNEVGPYQSPMEDGMQHFHEWYRGVMGNLA